MFKRPQARAIATVLVLVLLGISWALPASAGPCDTAAHRAFDFWLGDWEVQRPDGTLAGHNQIEKRHGGCVLHEHYTTDRGYSGESLNLYDASRGVWHQTWTDSSGTLLLLEGNVQEGRMVLEGQTVDAEGKITRHRLTWTPNADSTVRQHWESSTEDGKWSTAFDGTYRRVPAR